jgi:hypothetical protein
MCICQLFLHPTSKHQTWISSMVSLHSMHSATNNEKYSQNSNEASLVNEMKNAL